MLDYQLGDVLPVHDHGYVKLLEVMGSDETIVDAARISYDRRGRSEDRALIRYLLRHRHTSPFEMGVLRFEVKMPIFVARQWIRHRTASLNEMSARYTELPDEMFVPEVVAVQSKDNKQGRDDQLDEAGEHGAKKLIAWANEKTYSAYEELLARGVAREIARGVLPVNVYTKFVWKMDLHNLMHFLDLRLDPHAQKEIRDFAEVIEKLVALHFPLSYEAFVDYVRDSYTCSRMEVDLIREILTARSFTEYQETVLEGAGAIMSKRELDTFKRVFLDE
jgi:thymidylate synthase (FAD)